MSDSAANQSNPQDGESIDMGETIDMGEPIGALAGFDGDTSGRLVARIRRTIHRRATTVQLLSFSWSAPAMVLKEFWLMLIEQTNPSDTGKDGGHQGKTS